MKILSVVGARPQFVKLGPLSKEIRKYHDEIIVHTGQHYDKNMSDNFFNDLDIPYPDFNLEVGSGMQGEQTAEILRKIEGVIKSVLPDIVIVFGDTNTTLAAALAAAKMKIKVVHVEAGLRSFNREMPEEINRIVADHVSDYLFAPTETAVNHLRNEGLSQKTYLTGDIMVDSINYAVSKIEDQVTEKEDFVLLTFHRPYNVDDPKNLSAILEKISRLETKALFPVHPRTKRIIGDHGIRVPANITICDPVGYLDFIELQNRCKMILTDSGGIQKEAYILKKPCVTLRTETEWVETVQTGWNLLIDPAISPDEFIQTVNGFSLPATHPDIFGTSVAEKMAGLINSFAKNF